MRPYFSVGEEVILCSNDYPQYNGCQVIEGVYASGEIVKCRITGYCGPSSDLGYRISGICIQSDNGKEGLWRQSVLRKKHKPSDQSFQELIKSTRELKV